MITAVHARILILPLCLLAFAASAHAECAWVLWGFPVSNEAPFPLEAHTTKQECDAARQQARQDDRQSKRPHVAFTCFPDTVDPRGRKGGRR